MTLHQGRIYQKEDISLRDPDLNLADQANLVNYTELDWKRWREQAKTDPSVYYFSIYLGERLVGEIFLHDIDLKKKESLLGYHLFDPEFRGKGIGTKALELLVQFVKEEISLNKLVIITGEDNIASRKMAEKCGFINTGPSLEDPKRVVYELKIDQ